MGRMQTSYFLARLLGPLLALTGLGLVARTDAFREMALDFLHSRALIYLSGFLGLVAGLAMVLTHNVWVADWRVIVTIIAWLTLLTGAVRLLFPERVATMARSYLARRTLLPTTGAVWLVVGLVLCFFGYFR
jgi:uncharacterized membrane protein